MSRKYILDSIWIVWQKNLHLDLFLQLRTSYYGFLWGWSSLSCHGNSSVVITWAKYGTTVTKLPFNNWAISADNWVNSIHWGWPWDVVESRLWLSDNLVKLGTCAILNNYKSLYKLFQKCLRQNLQSANMWCFYIKISSSSPYFGCHKQHNRSS